MNKNKNKKIIKKITDKQKQKYREAKKQYN